MKPIQKSKKKNKQQKSYKISRGHPESEMSAVIHVVNILLQRQSESYYSMMTLEFSEAFSPKVTTSPTKAKIHNWFQNCCISGEGYPWNTWYHTN